MLVTTCSRWHCHSNFWVWLTVRFYYSIPTCKIINVNISRDSILKNRELTIVFYEFCLLCIYYCWLTNKNGPEELLQPYLGGDLTQRKHLRQQRNLIHGSMYPCIYNWWLILVLHKDLFLAFECADPLAKPPTIWYRISPFYSSTLTLSATYYGGSTYSMYRYA